MHKDNVAGSCNAVSFRGAKPYSLVTIFVVNKARDKWNGTKWRNTITIKIMSLKMLQAIF